ncbi:hypothetical protein, partial [Myxococcus xanthus]
ALMLAYFLPAGLVRLTTVLNIAGALWLGSHYEKLVPTAKQHVRKSLWKPLLVSALIVTPLLVAALAPQWMGLD